MLLTNKIFNYRLLALIVSFILTGCGGNNTLIGMGTATLSWTPPIENVDGSVLADLAGYKVYYGTTEGNYPSVIDIDNPGIAAYVVENLAIDTYYFVVTAYDTSGNESSYSNIASKSVN